MKPFHCLIVTRFSFLGTGGWQHKDGGDESDLFNDERMDLRFELFENIHLKSLEAQTDPHFFLYILTSNSLPDAQYARLFSLCAATLGTGRFFIDRRRPARTKKFLRFFIEKKYADLTDEERIIQIVLDDDDGLSNDFVERVKSDAMKLRDKIHAIENPYIITYSKGLLLSQRPNDATMYEYERAFINLGLSFITDNKTPKNVLSIAHFKAVFIYEHTVMDDALMHVRSFHGYNDSGRPRKKEWPELPDYKNNPEIQSRFPYLLEYIAKNRDEQ